MWALPNTETVDVQVVAIDNLLPELVADVMIIDVEGYKVKALKGMQKKLERSNIKIFSEYWPEALAKAGDSSQEYCKLMSDCGLKVHLISEDGNLVPCEFGELATTGCQNLFLSKSG